MMAELSSSKMDLHALIKGKYCLPVISPRQRSSNNASQTTSELYIPIVQTPLSPLLLITSFGGSLSSIDPASSTASMLAKDSRPEKLWDDGIELDGN